MSSLSKIRLEKTFIISLVLSDTNGGINAVCSGPLDTSLVDTNMDEFIIKNKVGEDIKYNDASSDNKKVKLNIFVNRKSTVDTCTDKVVEGAKNKGNLKLNCTKEV